MNQQHEYATSNADPEVLCRVRDVAWFHERLHVLQEILVRKNGTGSVCRSLEFYGPRGEVNVDMNVPEQLFEELEREVEAGNTFSLIEDVPTFVEGLADSRALMRISPGINRLRSLVDQLFPAPPSVLEANSPVS